MKTVTNKLNWLMPLLAFLWLQGCNEVADTFEHSVRSGTVANDTAEAPLTEKAQKYAKALETSNQFLALWQTADFQTIHDTLIDKEMQETLTVEKLADIHKNVTAFYGPIQGFKNMQWAFEPKRKKRQYFLFSIKVVQHEKGKANYLFQFLLDGGFEKLIGIYVREPMSLRAPGQIHSNVQ